MVNSDSNSVLNRAKRYTTVSSVIGSNVVNLIFDKIFRADVNHSKQARNIAASLGDLKGPLMKIAQILSTIPDAVPKEYVLEFQSLQAEAPAMGWPFVKRRMKAELGNNWQDNFSYFNQQANFAASLGQVHQAISLSGEKLACKLQYPDMQSATTADLNQLKLCLKLYDAYLGALKTEEVLAEVTARLNEELDYTLEADNIALYRKIFAGNDSINIPKTYDELSTDKLLTMEWLDGKHINDILDYPQEYRNNLGKIMFYAWYHPFYSKQIIHADPHLGNYTFGDGEKVNILDFGCVRRFSKSFVQGVIDLYYALYNNDKDLAVHAYQNWGFKDLSNEVIEILNMWAGLLYEPLLEDNNRYIQKDNNGVYGREMAYKVHTELRKVGGIEPPREFVFMDRAAVGIGSLCMHLRAKNNWHDIYHALIHNKGYEIPK